MFKKFILIVTVLLSILLIGCSQNSKENQSVVTVSGIGTVLVNPDMVQMNVSSSYTAQTTKAAKEEVDKKINQILSILKEEKIEDKNIKTVSLSYNEDMEYRNGSYVKLGQKAQQTIVIVINDIVNYPDKFPSLLDRLAAIDYVSINDIRFDIENKTELFKQSRELAFQKAYDKALQYAELSGLKLDKVITITEARSRDFYGFAAQSNVAFDSAAFSTGASIPTGEQEVTTEINITFLMKK